MTQRYIIFVNRREHTVQLERDEGGEWVAECLDLPGCLSEGNTLPEAMYNINQAIMAVEEVIAEERSTQQVADSFAVGPPSGILCTNSTGDIFLPSRAMIATEEFLLAHVGVVTTYDQVVNEHTISYDSDAAALQSL